MLTPAFFADVRRVLAPRGHVTIFSDNGRYCRSLAAMLGTARTTETSSELLFTSVELDDAPHFEQIGRVRLYHGVPGPECGHLCSEQSYFDRFWEYRQGEDTERFYMLLRRN